MLIIFTNSSDVTRWRHNSKRTCNCTAPSLVSMHFNLSWNVGGVSCYLNVSSSTCYTICRKLITTYLNIFSLETITDILPIRQCYFTAGGLDSPIALRPCWILFYVSYLAVLAAYLLTAFLGTSYLTAFVAL